MNDEIRRLMGAAPAPKPATMGPGVTPVPARMAQVPQARQAVPEGNKLAPASTGTAASADQAARIKVLEMELELARLKAGLPPGPDANPNLNPNPVPNAGPTFQFETRTDLTDDQYEPIQNEPGSRAAVVNKTGFVLESPISADAILSAAQPPPPGPPNLAAQSRAFHRFGPPRFDVATKA